MPLADYLASKYLSADSQPSKKRKRKSGKTGSDEAANHGITIADDNPNDWTRTRSADDNEDEDGPTVANTTFEGGLNIPSKKVKWIQIGTSAPKDSEQAAADAILADAQKESQSRTLQDDEAPAVVGEVNAVDAEAPPAMASGAAAGLQTAEQVTAALRKKERAEKKAMKDAGLDSTGKAQETIYRDASGRIINVAMKRAELRAKADEEARKKREKEESSKGDVQRREKEEKRQQLEEAKIMKVARYADDQQLNDELKERERWNDPMAFMSGNKKSAKANKKGGRKMTGKTYQGPSEPNRYGLRPGWRWDGVDRGNGFERKWFAARNKQKDRQDLEYAWQVDV
nr:pre-mrna-splicing factor cwc26 [Quercus suber]